MKFVPRCHSTFWDVLTFDDDEIESFFPKDIRGHCRLKNGNLDFIDPRCRILRQDIYEWCLAQFGPEFYMENDLDRIYYDMADVPDITKKSNQKLLEKRHLYHRWCLTDHRGIAFTDAKDAMLFKLIWSARGTP